MLSPNFQAGRIHKQAFIVLGLLLLGQILTDLCQLSTAVFLALCLLSTASRFYVRVRIQKQFSIDDGFLIVALCCLTCALVIMYSLTVDKMYLVQAFSIGLPGADIPPDFLQQSYDFHKWITVSLMLAWCAIIAVKFSFLFLFWKLIDRLQPLVIYWWVVTAFNIVVLGYGVSVYYVACPYYNDPNVCTSNKHQKWRIADAMPSSM